MRFKSLEKKLESMQLDKTLSKLKAMTRTSSNEGRGDKEKNTEDDQSCSSADSSFSLDGGTSRTNERPTHANVEGSTFRPSARRNSSDLSPAPLPPPGESMSPISERPATPRIAPLPERKTASKGVSENIRIGHDDCNQQYDEGSTNCILEPVVTARYPPVDHPDQPLNPMIPKFCYPRGDVIVPLREYKMPTVHYFVLTDSRGGKMYGTCLTVHEEITLHSDVLEIVSGEKNDWSPSRKGGQERGYVECSVNGSYEALHRTENQKYYAPRVLCLLSTWPYLSAFRTYLTQLYRLGTSTNLMTAPLERYILNICSEVPAPPPGSFQVNVSILDSKIGFWAPPADQPIPYVSLPYGLLFECLDIGNVLFVWYTLACERKVLLVSSQLSLLTVCAEILCSMLFPLRLPRFLTPMLDAPMPYLIGISREIFPYAVGDISDETVVVDLDRNVITMGDRTPELPIIPQRRKMKLEETLEKHAGDVFWKARGLKTSEVEQARLNGDVNLLNKLLCTADSVWDEKICTMDQAFVQAHAPDSMSLVYSDTVTSLDAGQSRWDAVQEAFLRFYVSMLKDYRKFMPPVPKNQQSSWRGSGSDYGGRFRAVEFVNSQLPDFQPFLEELIGTQQFDDFVTRRMYNAGKAPDVTFFDQSIDAKRNRSKLNLKKRETPFLHSANAHRNLKQIDAIPPNRANLPPRSRFDVTYDMKKGSYTYPTWPESFDQSLYGTPRPTPKIITAEFDRRLALTAMLSNGRETSTATRRLAGSNNPSPEATAFVLFFTTFSYTIGKEWSLLVQQNTALSENILDQNPDAASIDSSNSEGPWNPKVNPPWMAGENFQFLHSTFHPTKKPDPQESIEKIHNNAPATTFHPTKRPDPPESMETIHNDADATDICNPDCINLCTDVRKVIDTPTFIGNPWARSTGMTEQPELSGTSSDQEELAAVIEKARAIAKAQIDLGYNTLIMMRKRKLPAESITYKTLIEACGRCGITHRAQKLMEMMTQDGLAVDPEVYFEFMKAFSNAEIEEMHTLRKEIDTSSEISTIMSHPSATSSVINSSRDSSHAVASAHPAVRLQAEAERTLKSMKTGGSKLLTGFQNAMSSSIAANRRAFKIAKGKQMKRLSNHSFTKKDSLRVTDAIATHLVLSQCILEDLYPGIIVDADSDTCPKCSFVLDQDCVISGWKPCQTKDYTTMCPSCKHRFIPKFSVSCNLDTFEGSQGKGTPLYCDYLSPWVLLREIRSLVNKSVGSKATKILGADVRDIEPVNIDRIIDPKFREGCGINATLWWNMIVAFTRFKIPYTYLLQGSYEDQQLIMPSMTDDV
ncbi:LOW QUALITY PROTEIN: hypothetical protein ACHAXA_006622 [Cyclostephanos tholiformis]|uniref:UDENN domain-containing protein n=1 Tax=Cyclostephanos tholiformis TaxID=382380 RepID=A0ABD3R9W8_9STRA